MDCIVNSKFIELNAEILDIPKVFHTKGALLFQHRNIIKTMDINDITLNVKSFRIPHIINRFAYKYIRQSKAKRSYKYAEKLLSLGISTPQPVAYIENSNLLGLTESYYISLQSNCDYVFKDLLSKNICEIEDILIEFTRFTYKMHSKGVFFIDHSPGNTLISKTDNGYDFCLVDLNRTKFYNKEISLDLGIKNFYRLGSTPEMVEVMAKEYALLRGADEEYVLNKMMQQTMAHNLAVAKKKAKRKAR